jgi:DNA-binding transcriptional regulator YdaS (Cro superfamily)
MRKSLVPPDTPSARALTRAIAHFGSQEKAGVAVGKSQMCIWWALKNGSVSGELAVAFEHATQGLIRREDFRPDLFDYSMRASVQEQSA